MNYENEETNLLLEGKDFKYRDYVITMGLSEGSQGVMFVLYGVEKAFEGRETFPQNPYSYMGQLSNDFDQAVKAARLKVPTGVKIHVWDDVAMADRKAEVLTIPFGKYKGTLISELVDKDFKYVYWMSQNCTFKGKQLIEAMSKYASIARDMIIEENEANEKPLLEIEAKTNIKTLKIAFVKLLGARNAYSDDIIYKTTLFNEDGNRFVYTGKRLGVKDETIELKCKVKQAYTFLGRNYNKLNLR